MISGHGNPRFTLRQLVYLVAVSRAGGVKQAAQILHVAPSSVSEAITQLEESFGLRLFVRLKAHGVRPTSDGVRIIASARQLLDSAREFEEGAAGLGQGLTGTLQIGCVKTIAPIILPGLMRRFTERHPGVSIASKVGDQFDLLRGLTVGELDLAIIYQMHLDRETDFHPLMTLPPYILLGPALAARFPQETVSLADMAPYDLILLDLPVAGDYYLSLFQLEGVAPRIAHRTTALAMVKSLASNDFGYGLLNERSINDRAVDGKILSIRALRGSLPPLTLGVAQPRGMRATRKTEAFIGTCRDGLLAGPPDRFFRTAKSI
ncbi:LysR family transcriptional regulator [Ancylobacter terrae]|uniref:LysR family transcriptional regulator n=1 Tax=Ancylobacter sp. sgz301288 TaxID=3342077 RepID=UPI00385A4EDB